MTYLQTVVVKRGGGACREGDFGSILGRTDVKRNTARTQGGWIHLFVKMKGEGGGRQMEGESKEGRGGRILGMGGAELTQFASIKTFFKSDSCISIHVFGLN